MAKKPVFHSKTGSTQDPGVIGTIFPGRTVSAYEVFTVPNKRLFVMTLVSASVTRGPTTYPPDYLNDYGEVGYVDADGDHFHFLPFTRSEPDGILFASQALELYVPANAKVIVKVPLLPDQSGGAAVNVSGYYLTD